MKHPTPILPRIKILDLAVEELADDEDVEKMKRRITQNENEIEIKIIKVEEKKIIKGEVEIEIGLFQTKNMSREQQIIFDNQYF